MLLRKLTKQGGKYYKKFLLSYIMILVLPISIGSFAYNKAIKVIEKDAIEARLFMLKQSSSIVNNYLNDMELNIFGLAEDSRLLNVLYKEQPKYGAQDIDDFNKAKEALKANNISRTFNSEMYVFLKQPNVAIKNSSIDFGIDSFYKNFMSYENETYDKWYDETLDKYHSRELSASKSIVVNSKKSSFIVYEQSLPISNKKASKGVILLMISADSVNKLLKDVNSSSNGSTFIVDDNNRVITGVSKDGEKFPMIKLQNSQPSYYYFANFNGVNNIVMCVKSNYNNWNYVSILPYNSILDNAMYIKKVVYTILAIILLLGLLLSLYLANKNITPLKEVISSLRGSFNGDSEKINNEYDFIKNSVKKLINNNKELEKSMKNQELLLESTFISQLLKGQLNDEREIHMLLNHLNIDLEGKQFVLFVVKFSKISILLDKNELLEQDVNRIIVEKILNSRIQNKGYSHILDAEKIAIIFNCGNENCICNKEEIESIISDVRNELLNQYNITARFSGGNFYNKLIDISFSFNEAIKTINYLNEYNNDEYLIWHEDVKNYNSSYYYPIEIEQQLINMAKSGNKEGVMRLLDVIIRENYDNSTLTIFMEKQLFQDMAGSIIKIGVELKKSINIKKIIYSKYNDSIIKENLFEMFKDAYMDICDVVEEKKKSHNTEMLEKIVNYINVNYVDPNISICSIALKFNITESYFSHFFKEQTMKSFSDYLEDIRIEKACTMLVDRKISVEEIAKLTGYNSAYSFRRAFKRCTGIIPTSYRC